MLGVAEEEGGGGPHALFVSRIGRGGVSGRRGPLRAARCWVRGGGGWFAEGGGGRG